MQGARRKCARGEASDRPRPQAMGLAQVAVEAAKNQWIKVVLGFRQFRLRDVPKVQAGTPALLASKLGRTQGLQAAWRVCSPIGNQCLWLADGGADSLALPLRGARLEPRSL